MTNARSRNSAATRGDEHSLAPLLAIIGSDGAGKTTLASYLCAALQEEGATYSYLGLGSGTMGLKIQAWPFIGPMLARRLTAKAKQARTRGERIPGPFTALTIYGFATVRMHRFKKTQAMRECAAVVICDRYPQLEVPGFYDGPGLSAARPNGPFTAWLARRELKLYESMVRVRPTVIIRLNIDAQTAYARKPDHDLTLIKQKTAITPRLCFNGARIVEIDATLPLSDVQAQCLQVALQVISNHQANQAAMSTMPDP
ncbi:MAG TPA: hypothetical protein DIW52_25255 [Pseudomonas sp.]|jgi:thymidylate kinase|nr:hypothetical protein [Pseudomonas sp.]